MTTLNKYAAEIIQNFPVHACTDVTGFGFLGHLHEMLGGTACAVIEGSQIPHIPEALVYAEEFLITGAAQRNRNYLEGKVGFGEGVAFGLEELLFDPQTSGGLLVSVPKGAAEELLQELQKLELPAGMVGEIVDKGEKEIWVR